MAILKFFPSLAPQPPPQNRREEIWGHFRAIFAMVGLFWLIWVYDIAIPDEYSFCQLGIQPLNWRGLPGILFSPFIHDAPKPGEIPWHLFGNSIAFFTLGLLVRFGGAGLFWKVFFLTWFISGLGAWFFGDPEAFHYGSSGIIFGFFGFLLVRGILQCSLLWTGISIIAGALHAGMVYQLIPQEGVSVVSHVWGLLGGMIVAWHEYCYKRHKLLMRLDGGAVVASGCVAEMGDCDGI